MKSVLTIGNFDGVHRGHRALVESLLGWRRKQEKPSDFQSVVLTFEPHPIEILKPGVVVPKLCSNREKKHLLQSLGIDRVIVLPFSKEFALMPAQDFLNNVVIKDFDPAYIAIGHNFYFGHKREGTPEKLVEWCAAQKIAAKQVDPIEADADVISSSRIRKLIQEGQMISASRLLGRDYSITNEVIHGNKKGREIGFPTANMSPEFSAKDGPGLRCVPAAGVYLSSSTVDGKTFASITNVGIKPTVQNNGPLLIETHILDFDGDVYGKQLTVEFKDRIRAEQKFNGLSELKLQIQKDTDLARSRLSHK